MYVLPYIDQLINETDAKVSARAMHANTHLW